MTTDPSAPEPQHDPRPDVGRTPGADADPLDETTLDPAAILRLIQDQQERVRRREPDGRVLYGSWGAAWLVGYLSLYFSADGTGQPAGWAFVVFFGLLAAAMGITIAQTMLVTRGVRGVSARTGAMYGWSWTLAFVAYGIIIGGLDRAGASGQVIALVANGFACVIVGVQYLAAGALFQQARSYVLGAWILFVAAVATSVGIDATFQVMAVLGGGGLLVMALIDQVLRLRRHPEGRATTERREPDPGPEGSQRAEGAS